MRTDFDAGIFRIIKIKDTSFLDHLVELGIARKLKAGEGLRSFKPGEVSETEMKKPSEEILYHRLTIQEEL